MLKEYIKKLIAAESLTEDESYTAGRIMLNQDVPREQVAAFLVLLSRNRETVSELVGLIRAIRVDAKELNISSKVVDIVGTGGDYSQSINISTAAALLTAACGVPVVKHGNRAITSSCGSADVLEELGYVINQSPSQVIEEVKLHNFAFCFAPNFHPILLKLREIRRNLGVTTILNLLGPMLNPARAEHIVLGVNDRKRVELIAKTLLALKTTRSIVFSGNGIDELSCAGKTEALLVSNNGIEAITIDPLALGLRQCKLTDLVGGDRVHNATVMREIMSGNDTIFSDTIILNAAVALFIYGKVAKIEDGIILARDRLKQGNILKQNRLQEIISRKQQVMSGTKAKSLKAALLNKANKNSAEIIKSGVDNKLDGAIIAEIKRASPSAGKISEITDPVGRALEYVKAGASAISVLTDEGFAGSISDLKMIAEALKDTNVPILCKDFFLDPQQIAKAAEAGANAILIMISVLGRDAVNMIGIAHAFGLETLVEVHNKDELEIALSSGGDIIGINQRDLRDFTMHPEVLSQLIKEVPDDVVTVAESGMENGADVNRAFSLGYDAVLVGTALSKLKNPSEFFV